jgi:hypothetical protein
MIPSVSNTCHQHARHATLMEIHSFGSVDHLLFIATILVKLSDHIITTLSMSFLFFTKDNAANAPKMDINRVRIRLEGLSQYASVSAMLLNAALRLPAPKKLDENKSENIVKIVYAVAVTSTVLAALYTIMVFSLLSLYSKSFLGMNMDEEYLEFFTNTNPIRKSAFLSFICTVLLFYLSFILSLVQQYEGRLRYWITTGSVIFIAMGIHQWKQIMYFASAMYENQ